MIPSPVLLFFFCCFFFIKQKYNVKAALCNFFTLISQLWSHTDGTLSHSRVYGVSVTCFCSIELQVKGRITLLHTCFQHLLGWSYHLH